MPNIWLYHKSEPQGRIVDTSLVDILMAEGWVKSPRDLPPGLFFGNDGTSKASSIPLVDVQPAAVTPTPAEVAAVVAPVDDAPAAGEDIRWKDMTRAELFALAKNTYGESIPANTRRDAIIARIKELEGDA